MLKKLASLFCAVLLILSFSSCKSVKQLKDMSIIQGIGIDKDDEDFIVTVQIFDTSKASGSSGDAGGNITITYSAKGESVTQAFVNSQKVMEREAFLAQNKIIVISEQAVNESLNEILDYFVRDESIRSDVIVAVTKDNAGEIIKSKSKDAVIPAENAQRTIINGENYGVSAAQLVLDVTDDYLSPVSDVFFPVLKVQGEDEDKTVSSEGIAVYSNGKIQGYLNDASTRSVLLSNDRLENGVVVLENTPQGKISVKITSAKAKSKAKITNGRIKYTLNANVECTIDELQSGVSSSMTKQDVKKLENYVAEQIKRDMINTLDMCLKKYSCDVFYIGRLVSMQNSGFYKNAPKDFYSQIKNVDYDINITCKALRADVEALKQ